MLKSNGDMIASEFYKLLESKKMKKIASAAVDEKVDEACDYPKSDEISDTELDKIMVEPNDNSDDDYSLNQLDEAIDKLSEMDEVSDPAQEDYITEKEASILYGLGKIAGSLRSKNQHYGADLTEATARSIAEDIRVEAAKRKDVITNLNKIASKLDNSGDIFGGDLVRVTINNIMKG